MERKCFKFKTIEFWPENGSVMVIDTEKADDNTKSPMEVVKAIKPKEFMKRALAVYALSQGQPPSEQYAARRLVEQAEVVVKEALNQGDLSEPEVFDWHMRHKIGRRNRIIIPHSYSEPRVTIRKEPATKILKDGYVIDELPIIGG